MTITPNGEYRGDALIQGKPYQVLGTTGDMNDYAFLISNEKQQLMFLRVHQSVLVESDANFSISQSYDDTVMLDEIEALKKQIAGINIKIGQLKKSNG